MAYILKLFKTSRFPNLFIPFALNDYQLYVPSFINYAVQ